MKPRLLIALFALAIGVTWGFLSSVPGSEDRVVAPGKSYSLTAAVNTFGKKAFTRGEAVPVAVALANSGTESVFVSPFSPPAVELFDAEGRAVKGAPIDVPAQGPPWSITRGGKRIMIEPVWELPGKSGRVIVLDDALARYHKYLVRGAYTLRVRVASGMYDRDSVIRREDTVEKFWVERNARWTGPSELRANDIEIRIE